MKANQFDHDDCLRALATSSLTEHQKTVLNIVAGSYACNEHVDTSILREARAITETLHTN